MKKPFFFLWVSIGVILLFSWIYLPAISRYQDLKTRQDGMEIQIQDLQTKLKDIREERDLLKNDAGYLEKVIREELGLVKPGEIVYKFVQEKPVETPAPSTPVADPEPPAAAAKKETPPPPAPIPVKQPAISVPAKVVPPARTPSSVSPVPAAAAADPAPPAAPREPVYPRRETR